MKYNMLCDGVFHAAALVVTALGVYKLWQARGQGAVSSAPTRFGGSLLVGWGGFNLVEGLIDHQWLELHHVRPGPNELYWDLGFLAASLLVMILGGALIQRDEQRLRQVQPLRGYGR